MPGVSQGLYNFIFRKNFVFLATVFSGAFAFEILFDTGSDKIWDAINRGRQWKDIRSRYLEQEE
ncbi:MAG: qcr9 subunit 9 of the ubiquinol cytochrome-c reductase complex [Sarcosagium campestre]|nr:MAG: qcr9 subunit 9 of the ubiquinol cytochrome-c reductase complex [Sarcosagium campestre]